MTKPTSDEFSESVDTITSRAQDAYQTGSEYVRENPIPIIIGAVLFGAVLGVLLAPKERRPREPKEIARDLLETIYDDLSDKIPRLKKQAVSTKDCLVDQVQEFGQKLKWW